MDIFVVPPGIKSEKLEKLPQKLKMQIRRHAQEQRGLNSHLPLHFGLCVLHSVYFGA